MALTRTIRHRESVYRFRMTGIRLWLGLIVAGTVGACGGKASGLGAAENSGASAGTAPATAGASSTSGAAGGSSGTSDLEDCIGGATFVYAVRSLATQEVTTTPDGSLVLQRFGFDLDGRDSDGTQPEDCGAADAVSADGRRGIDNTIAGLWSEDFEPSFRRGFASGSEMSIRLSGVDSFEDDSCVDISWADEVPQFRRAKIEAGRLFADGSEIVAVRENVPDLSNYPLVFPLSSPRIAFRPTADALSGGIVGGSITRDELIDDYVTLVGGPTARGIAGTNFAAPDLPANGVACAVLSAGFGFEATVEESK